MKKKKAAHETPQDHKKAEHRCAEMAQNPQEKERSDICY